MPDKIYLVEGYWHHYDSEDHWFPAAFLTQEEAEQYRQQCQEWIEHYVDEFWEEFVRQFGEPRERETCCIYVPETPENMNDEEYINPGHTLSEEWFGYRYLFDDQDEPLLDPQGEHRLDPADFGRNRMRRLGPDPLIDVSFVAGNACRYRVVEVRCLP